MNKMIRTRPYIILFLLTVAIVALPATASAQSSDSSSPLIHRVQNGDTLDAIAEQYGVTNEQLMEWNNLRDASAIYAGERLVVQPTQSDGETSAGKNKHVVRRGQTLAAIAAQHEVTADDIKQANKLSSSVVYVGQRLRIPPTGSMGSTGIVHEVKQGETLGSIAEDYGLTVAELTKLNGIKKKSLIKVGQVLAITEDAKKQKSRGPKKIVVDISAQRCTRYEGDVKLNTWACSTGQKGHATAAGTFRVQSKLRKAFGSTWNIWMPNWLGIYWAGSTENGFHGLPWKANTGRKIWGGLVGTPATFGCVMLHDGAMRTLWKWADIGTKVVIKY